MCGSGYKTQPLSSSIPFLNTDNSPYYPQLHLQRPTKLNISDENRIDSILEPIIPSTPSRLLPMSVQPQDRAGTTNRPNQYKQSRFVELFEDMDVYSAIISITTSQRTTRAQRLLLQIKTSFRSLKAKFSAGPRLLLAESTATSLEDFFAYATVGPRCFRQSITQRRDGSHNFPRDSVELARARRSAGSTYMSAML